MPGLNRRAVGPIGRRRGEVYGGQPLPLPLVAAIGVTNLEATSATVTGSVNPQGLSGTYWFVWGTTPQFGNQTTPTAIGAVAVPQTFLTVLTGLTTGTTYYFAIVSSTAAGTVTSLPLEFTPAVPTVVPDASEPVTPVAVPSVAIPHFSYPYKIQNSAAVVVEQNSLQEVTACVQVIVNCRVGACPELPTFGIPDLTFQAAPPSPNAIVQAVQQWEPRANETVVVSALDETNADFGMSLTTSVAGTGQ